MATVLIQNGTLHEGDAVVVGSHSGRIRALIDPAGRKVKQAGPSDPVELLGLSGVPAAGDVLVSVSDERKARQIAGMRADRDKLKIKAATRITLEGLQKQIQIGRGQGAAAHPPRPTCRARWRRWRSRSSGSRPTRSS